MPQLNLFEIIQLKRQVRLMLTRIVFIANLLFWTCLVSYVFFGSTSYNMIQDSIINKNNVVRVMPEGWAFFTRNARESILSVYHETNGGKKLENLSIPQSSPKFLFGLSKYQRAFNVDIGALSEKLTTAKWREVEDGRWKNKIPVASDTIQLNSKFLSGRYIIVLQERKPYAWSHLYFEMPCKVARIYVKKNF